MTNGKPQCTQRSISGSSSSQITSGRARSSNGIAHLLTHPALHRAVRARHARPAVEAVGVGGELVPARAVAHGLAEQGAAPVEAHPATGLHGAAFRLELVAVQDNEETAVAQ